MLKSIFWTLFYAACLAYLGFIIMWPAMANIMIHLYRVSGI